jgi:molecular chaperone DnaK
MGEIFGIDLGTSSCSVAQLIDGQPQVLPVFDGHDEMPTYVAFTPDGERLIGWPAKRQAITNPANTIFTIKRLIGRKFASEAAQAELGLLPYSVVPSGSGGLWVEAGGRTYTPTEITAMMLTEAKRSTEAYLGCEVTQAVITVPAHFDEGQRAATRNAAAIAGISALRLIAEPTSAAMALGFGRNRSGSVAVYDLGGGTFDISILEIGDGVFEVKAVNGDNRLGGEDFDHRLVRYFADELGRDYGIDVANDPLALHRIKDAAEQLKIQLDTVQNASIDLPYLAVREGKFFNYEMKMSRPIVDRLFDELIERTIGPCRQAFRDAGLKTTEIDELILVGGMSRAPRIRERMSEFFGRKPLGHADPSRVVALGAAVLGGVLRGEIKDVLLLDVVPFSLGFERITGEFVSLIDKNTTIPTKKFEIITEAKHLKLSNGKLLLFQRDYEEEVKIPLAGISLETVITPSGAFEPFELTFSLDAEPQLEVIIKNLRTGQEQSTLVSVNDSYSEDITEQETTERIARDVHTSEKALAAVRAKADELLTLVNAGLSAYGANIHTDLLEKFGNAREQLQRAMQSRDAAELIEALDAFAKVTNFQVAQFSAPRTALQAAPLPAPVEVRARTAIPSVFISYARPDRLWLDRLRVHLAPLERDGQVEIWHDGKIDTGAPWRAEIEQALTNAAAAILMISANFMASTFIYENELPPILRRHSGFGLSIFPLFIGHCFYQRDPVLSTLNAFNDPSRPISAMSDHEAAAEFARLTGDLWRRLAV